MDFALNDEQALFRDSVRRFADERLKPGALERAHRPGFPFDAAKLLAEQGLLGITMPALITHPDWALTAIIVADTWQWFPFTMLMTLAALQMMPQEMVDAARVDGASAWQMTWHVTLPFLKGVLLVAGLFRLIDSIKAFPLIFILTEGGPGSVTEVTNYYSFLQAFNFSFLGYSSAITVVMLAATVLLSWAIIRLVGWGQHGE